jgi:hypothetical protein
VRIVLVAFCFMVIPALGSLQVLASEKPQSYDKSEESLRAGSCRHITGAWHRWHRSW